MANKRAVANVVGIVLAAGIAIALVTSAYLWGSQILDKRDATTKFLVAKNFMDSIDSEIERLVNNQGGEISLNLPGGSMGLVEFNSADPESQDQNNLIYTFGVNQPIVLEGDDIYLDLTSYADYVAQGGLGTFGESEAGVMKIKSTSPGQVYSIDLTLHYRELLTSQGNSVLIALKPSGVSQQGEHRINLAYADTTVMTIAGRNVQVFNINVEIN